MLVERAKFQVEANAASVGASAEWVALLLEQRILGVSQADGLSEAGWWWEVYRKSAGADE